MVSQAFSHFKIVSKLGAGGMGEVYLAEDKVLGRKVALKLLPASMTADQDRLRRFKLEARAASALNHPNILTIHEIGEANGHHFIAMEFVEGETLRQHVATSRLNVSAVIDFAIQTASALAAAHSKGIVHRDIKPENVMIRQDGYVKVLDFGLAKLTESDAGSYPEASTWAKTQPGVLIGTLQYMSPEQARGLPLDTRTDIWSLGVVLYELLSGRVPHGGATMSDVLVSILEHKPIPLTELAPKVPSELSRIVDKCLVKECKQRYQSAEELLDDLKTLKRDLETGAPTLIAVNSAPRSSLSRKWRIAAGALLVLLACGALAYALFFGRSRGIPTPTIKSLAVLPLKNLSGDPGNDYFADGMTETLITDLAKIEDVRVISRTTAMQYKSTEKSIPEIARELNVDGVVSGSILRVGDNVRVQVQLVQALPEEQHLLSETYDRNMRDVLALHSDVARAIASKIRIKLKPQDDARLVNARRVDPEAYRAYLKGMYHLNQATPEETEKGMALLNEAVQKDPTNPLPYAYLALGYATMGHGPSPPPDAFGRARSAALKALELDETIAEAHLVLAQLVMYEEKSWDWPAAERSLKRALELNPTLAAAHAHYAWYLVLFDRWDEGFEAMRRAQEVDPLTPLWPAWQGSLYWWTGRHDEAVQECQKALELNPNFPVALSVIGRAYSDQGKHKEAIAAQERAAVLNSAYLWSLAYAYARAGRRDDALKTAAEFKAARGDRYELGVVYLALGDREEAIRALETAFERGEATPWIRNLHVLASLRNDPRFQELLRRMNLPS